LLSECVLWNYYFQTISGSKEHMSSSVWLMFVPQLELNLFISALLSYYY
jgi:hypothetical protein